MNSVFMIGFHDSVHVFCIAEILAPYSSWVKNWYGTAQTEMFEIKESFNSEKFNSAETSGSDALFVVGIA